MGKAKTLTAQELRRVQDYIASRAHAARNRAMLLLTHLAGMRVGEVAALTWGDVVNAECRICGTSPNAASFGCLDPTCQSHKQTQP